MEMVYASCVLHDKYLIRGRKKDPFLFGGEFKRLGSFHVCPGS